ncbi:Uncharacterized protein Fot_34842 [Forsythia ovata]|uniref:Uncharacterized protein n=1 Tax=Forsythia ovata TaxID=205694 RepID=A0ABD1SMR1_9LAMI
MKRATLSKVGQPTAKLHPQRSTQSASSQLPEPQFEFMPTPGIISQDISGPQTALPRNHLQPNLSLDSMVDDLQLMENEEQARMKTNRSKNRFRSFQAPQNMMPN